MAKLDKPSLTAERLRQLLSYDPETGDFHWMVATAQRTKIGSLAGYAGKNGYRQMRVDGGKFLAHRLAWLYVHGIWPADQLDHINGARDDNRIANLREATHAQNQQNRKLHSNNSSGHKGVSWHNAAKKWRVQIGAQNRTTHVGTFASIDDAVAARKGAKVRSHSFQQQDREETP